MHKGHTKLSLDELTIETLPARFERTDATAFTNDPVFLVPRAYQLCDTVTIAPGTTRHIPYVLSKDWHYVAHEVYVVQPITDPEQDCHCVEPLPVEFTLNGNLRRGYMLHVEVPLTSALPDWNGFPYLKLKLEFQLERGIPEEILKQLGGDDYTEVSGLTSATPASSYQ